MLRDNNLLPDILKTIEKAKNEVLAVVYLVKYVRRRHFDQAKQVMDQLVAAKDRGVKVQVLIHVGVHTRRIPGWNLLVYRDLKERGLDVRVWKERRILHAKMFVIDRKILYLGSHNMSNCSLRESAELSARIESEELGWKAVLVFSEWWKKGI